MAIKKTDSAIAILLLIVYVSRHLRGRRGNSFLLGGGFCALQDRLKWQILGCRLPGDFRGVAYLRLHPLSHLWFIR